MNRVLNNEEIKVTFNQNFELVIAECKQIPRSGQKGTWITDEMELAYTRLHDMGIAESVEVWKDEELVGGMYGVRLGEVFSGESMFSKSSNASKLALIHFIRKFQTEGGQLFDCQVHSDHMARMGAEEISRESYLGFLR